MREFVWTQEAPWGPVTIRSTQACVHSVKFEATHVDLLSQPEPTVQEAFEAYFDGDPTLIDAIAVDLDEVGSATYQQVLELLRVESRFGQTMTYGELASRAGMEGAAQLVGQIMGANPVPIIVPCHRVVAADGSLGGFSGGLDTKRALFRLEGIVARRGGWLSKEEAPPTLF